MRLNPALDRIGYDGDRTPDLASLAALQRAFLLAVPFENLDIHLRRPISVELDHAVTKIVGAHRGGFCYECNGLFAAMLTALGFRVVMLSARMALDGRLSPAFDHMVLQVDLEAPYIVDVGNGESCRVPLRLDGANEGTAEGKSYRVDRRGDGFALMFREATGGWRPRFVFDSTPHQRHEFAEMCRYHQTSPKSMFTQKRLATLATRDGRITLVDRRFTRTARGQQDERELASETEYRRCLREQFGITLEDAPGEA